MGFPLVRAADGGSGHELERVFVYAEFHAGVVHLEREAPPLATDCGVTCFGGRQGSLFGVGGGAFVP